MTPGGELLSVERLADLLLGASCATAFTGAGISTESGLPDFRSGTGLWKGRDPMKMASLRALESNPSEFYEFYRMRIDGLRQARPNRGHEALARMEEMGVLRSVITQNVDGLHQEAGSGRVIELHGNLRGCECVSCSSKYPVEVISEGDSPPRCGVCGGLVKPGVVLFGEQLPGDALDQAFVEARGCGVFLVIGSSLEVSPANLLPLAAKDAGAALAILNMTPTHLDDRVDILLRDQCGETLARLASILERHLND